MTDALLQTKLHIPRTRSNFVSRPRLAQKLTRGLDRKLSLVAAPAGYGKTTLISEWLQQLSQPSQAAERPTRSINHAWLSLDPGDNDINRFFGYLVASLQTVLPRIGERALALALATVVKDSSALVTPLINEITESDLEPNQLIVVFDDYQVIHDQHVHDLVINLVTHLPPEVHLVIISRADPPLPLARMRVGDEITEIRDVDLRFTNEETGAFLNQSMNLNLMPEDVQALETRTEGWIASLQLAALTLQSPAIPQEDQHNFIERFAGSDRYVMDYLVEEVLHEQPPPIQDFLLQTAILNHLSGALCDFVLGTSEDGVNEHMESFVDTPSTSQETLEQLDRDNLFVIPLDNQRHWYRYHHLFGDLLRYRLREVYPERINDLHKRAANWFEQNGFMEEAIFHRLQAQAFEEAADLIERSAHDFFGQGQLMMVKQWIDVLPEDILRARPQIFLILGWILFRTGQFQALEAHLQLPLAQNVESFSDRGHSELCILHAYNAYVQGEHTQCIKLCGDAYERLHASDLALLMPTTSLTAFAYEALGDIPTAIKWLDESLILSQRANSLTATLVNSGILAQLHAEQGNLVKASAAFDRAIQMATQLGSRDLPLLGLAYIGNGLILQQQGAFTSAEQDLREGIFRCRQWGGLIYYALKGYQVLAQGLATAGDSDSVQDVLAEVLQLEREPDVPTWAVEKVKQSLKRNINQTTRHQTSPASHSLTKREQEVLRLLGEGLSSPQVAAQLVISVSTARTHIKRIYAKLNAHSRHEAITRARELQIL